MADYIPITLCNEHLSISQDILREVSRNLYRWGMQQHPDIYIGGSTQYGCPDNNVARAACERAAKEGRITWAHILVEEVAEALDTQSPADLRDELVQVAAVALDWIRDLDQRRAASEEHESPQR
jgi:precorrin-6B methylase 2